MPKLRPDEKMQRCEFEDHARIRSQKYYIRRSYYTDIEKHFCQGCLQILSIRGLVTYKGAGGYQPIESTTVDTLLNIYGEGVKV